MNRLILILLFTGSAFGRDPFRPADTWEWRRIEDPQIRSDGAWVVFVERWNDQENNAGYSNLRLVSADGKQSRSLTSGPWHDDSPRWSPDGKRLAWISDRSGAAAIRSADLDGTGEAEITRGGNPPLSLAWSPDGRWLAYTAQVAAAPAPAWVAPALVPFLEAPPPAVEIFLVPAGGGAPRQLTHASFPRRGPPVWMPDGRWILNAAEGAPDPANPLEGAEIYGIHMPDGEIRRLTEHPGPDENPVASPDGSKIAWIGAETKPPAYALKRLWTMGVDGKRIKMLTGSLDRDAADPQWSSDSRTLYFLADDRGATHVYAARNDGTVRKVTSRAERLRWFSLADNGRAVSIRSSANAADELVTFAVDLPGGVIPLASPNAHLLATRDIAPREEIHFTSDGNDVQAFLWKPLRADASRPLPLVVEAGETPRSMCGAEFSLRAQVFAARGFAVLCVNVRGTPGYGEIFGNLLRTRFPGDDFDDLMRGADAALAKGGLDSTRVFVTGGLLAAWAIGHTDRFAAAVLRNPITDWSSAVTLAPDGYRRAAAWMGALPWEDPLQYQKHSSLFFAQNFKIPVLVIGDDPQGREIYFALRARKLDCTLLRLPEDGKPGTKVAALESEIAWLERWSRPI